MRATLSGVFTSIAAALMLSLGFAGTATAQPGDEHMLELPIIIAACKQDPGNKIQPGGGKYSPEHVMAEYDCTPVEGVSITVSNLDIDFFDRCETDAKGWCEVDAPTDHERKLDVAIHMSTVPVGLAPKQVLNQTIHFSEFTGIGIPLFAEPDATPDTGEKRTTIAVNVAECEDGSSRSGCEREPVAALVQASTGEVTAKGQPWLATNDEGWVSWDRDLLGDGEIDLMLRTGIEPRFACSDVKTGTRLATNWIEGREGDFIRVTPDAGDNITCDITLLGD